MKQVFTFISVLVILGFAIPTAGSDQHVQISVSKDTVIMQNIWQNSSVLDKVKPSHDAMDIMYVNYK